MPIRLQIFIPSSPATDNYPSVPINLRIIDIPKWNHTVLELLGLAYFPQHNAHKVIYLVAFIRTPFLHEVEYYFIVCIYNISLIHLFIRGHLGCFYLLAIVNDAPIKYLFKSLLPAPWVCTQIILEPRYPFEAIKIFILLIVFVGAELYMFSII